MDGLSYSGHQPDYHNALKLAFPPLEQGERNLEPAAQPARDPNSPMGGLDSETRKDVEFAAGDIVRNMAGNKNLHTDFAELARKDPAKAMQQIEESLASKVSDPGVKKVLENARETRKDIDYATGHLVRHLVADKNDGSGLAALARRDPAMAAELIRDDLAAHRGDADVKERLVEAHKARLAETAPAAGARQQPKAQATLGI